MHFQHLRLVQNETQNLRLFFELNPKAEANPNVNPNVNFRYMNSKHFIVDRHRISMIEKAKTTANSGRRVIGFHF